MVVANSGAGSAEAGALGAALAVLRRRLSVDVAPTGSQADLDAVIARLDGRLLVVAGGDGTLHHALARLQAAGLLDQATIGLLPLGTGNDFARALGLPTDPSEAAAALLDGPTRTLDLATDDDGTIMVNAAHAGLGAIAAEHADALKQALGALAYPTGAVVAGSTAGQFDLDVTVDGRVLHSGPLAMVAVANGCCIGAGTPVCPGAALDDGLLDVMAAAPDGPAQRLAFALALRQGEHTEREDVVIARGERIEITGDAVAHDVDGELTEPVTARTYRILPSAWRLRG